MHIIKPLQAGAIGVGKAVRSSDVLFAEQLIESMLGVAENTRHPSLVIWGTYLFPYGRAALCVQERLLRQGRRSELCLTPPGSDFSELRPPFHRFLQPLS